MDCCSDEEDVYDTPGLGDEDDDGDLEMPTTSPSRCLFCDSTFPTPNLVFAQTRSSFLSLFGMKQQRVLSALGEIPEGPGSFSSPGTA